MSRSKWKGSFCAQTLTRSITHPLNTLSALGTKKPALAFALPGKTSLSKASTSPTSVLGKTNANAKTSVKTSGPQAAPGIKVWSRASTILPQFVGGLFHVHNGIRFIRLEVQQQMIGHKFGEFASTRRLPKHPKLKSSNVRTTKQATKQTNK